MVFIYLIIITIIILLLIYLSRLSKLPKLWYKCDADNYTNLLFIESLTKDGYKRTDKNNWDIYLFCKGDLSNKALDEIKVHDKRQKIFFIYNNADVGVKKKLWQNLENYYGRDVAETIMPSTYLYPKDEQLFKRKYRSGRWYFLKNEKQRQEGITITSNINEIMNHKQYKYDFIQENVPNPLLFKGHKLNFRVYLLVIKKGNHIQSYMYNDGIVSYAIDKCDNDNLTFNNSIASFYKSKQLYDQGYPIILSQLKEQMDIPWNKLHNRIKHKLKLIMDAIHHKLIKRDKGVVTFQLFGVDVISDVNMDPKILEINISPGMKPYDEHDRKMRSTLQDDVINLVNEDQITNFIDI